MLKLFDLIGKGKTYGMRGMRTPQGKHKAPGQMAGQDDGTQVEASGDAIVIADALHHIAESLQALTREIKAQGDAMALAPEDPPADAASPVDMAGRPIRY